MTRFWRLLLAAALTAGAASAQTVPMYSRGVLFTRGLVLGPNGAPIWAEFVTTAQAGGESVVTIAPIGEAVGELEGASVMSGTEYRQWWSAYKAISQDKTKQPQSVLSRAAYEALPGSVIAGERARLAASTRSVVINASSQVLHESALDLTQVQGIGADVRSVLLGRTGRVLRTSVHNIGYRTAFWGPDPGLDGDTRIDGRPGERALGPIAGARIYSPGRSGTTVSAADGTYTLQYFVEACRGHDVRSKVAAQIPYRNFNPREPGGVGHYYTAYDLWDSCEDGAGKATVANLPVDVIMLTGMGTMRNPGGSEIAAGPTAYDATPRHASTIPEGLDFNGNGIPDLAMPGEEGRVLVWFDRSAVTTPMPPPDLTRRLDQLPDFTDQGLLRSLSRDDLSDTDLYVFRDSNDQLLASRRKLGAEETAAWQGGGVFEDGLRFHFRITLRGPRNEDSIGGQLSEWQAATGVPAEFRGRYADHLRPGEAVRIVAINRPTGYIGTLRTTAHSLQRPDGLPPIELYPPNLRLWAERDYEVQSGFTQGEDRHYLIGSEGSALSTDKLIRIYSQWLDRDGRSLPSDLPGYTGRLAKLVTGNTLSPVGNQVAHFEIRPGLATQVVRLPEQAILANFHYYLHVSGTAISDKPDFSTGSSEGPLRHRPARFVPFQVAVFDEAATARARRGKSKPQEIAAVYRWPYRPELQFSLFTLDEVGFEARPLGSSGPQLVDLTKPGQPAIDWQEYLQGQDTITLIYELLGPKLPPLDPIGPERELIWSLGAEESGVLVQNERGEWVFKDPDHLANLRAEDLLALSLLQNSDSENILWEYAFARGGIAADTDRDGTLSFDTKPKPEGHAAIKPWQDVTTGQVKFRWWVNDDKDKGDFADKAGEHTPDAEASIFGSLLEFFGVGVPNHEDDVVNGRTDLVDFFPVALDLSELVQREPKLAEQYGVSSLTYRLRHADEALRFVYTDRTREQAFDYLTKENDCEIDEHKPCGYGDHFTQKVHDAETHEITAAGALLGRGFIEKIREGAKSEDPNQQRGVLLVEVTEPTESPLQMEVLAGETVVARAYLQLSAGPVRDHYRWLNLRSEPERASNHLQEPVNYPDALSSDKYFVFVHGCCTGEAAAEGWAAEVYKRMYVSGSKARFLNVAWEGDAGPLENYHQDVINAFKTGAILSWELDKLPGPKYIAGHSLGNMVVSSGISMFELKAERYYAIDAAVAMEAFDSTAWTYPLREGKTPQQIMPHPDWTNDDGSPKYNQRLWSTHWHQLFADDSPFRKALTWRGIFANIQQKTRVTNVYSSGEDVLANAPPDRRVMLSELLRHQITGMAGLGFLLNAPADTQVWTVQEKTKGYIIGGITGPSAEAGWVAGTLCYPEIDPEVETETGCSYLPEQVNDTTDPSGQIVHKLSDETLEQRPFFRGFVESKAGDRGLSENNARLQRFRLLASAIPALSYPTGTNAVDKIPENIDMMNRKNERPGGAPLWPAERLAKPELGTDQWRHSDFVTVAHFYTYRVYTEHFAEDLR